MRNRISITSHVRNLYYVLQLMCATTSRDEFVLTTTLALMNRLVYLPLLPQVKVKLSIYYLTNTVT